MSKDFDDRHYQIAPSDLVLNSYIVPGMAVHTFGVRPDSAEFGFQIPDIVPVVKFSFVDGREVRVRLHIDGLHLDLKRETPFYDLKFRAWMETCPSLYRVDLDVMRQQDTEKHQFPISGAEGLIDAA